MIRALAEANRSSVYLAAEGLDSDDLTLESVDELYRQADLRRYRSIYVAEHRNHEQIVGIALAYRGPLGFNFSFLENRCDLIVSNLLNDETRQEVITTLVCAVAEQYADFPPQIIPVIGDQRDATFKCLADNIFATTRRASGLPRDLNHGIDTSKEFTTEFKASKNVLANGNRKKIHHEFVQ